MNERILHPSMYIECLSRVNKILTSKYFRGALATVISAILVPIDRSRNKTTFV